MPVILRYCQLTEKQRSHPRVAHLYANVTRRHAVTEVYAEIPWRFCLWFRNALDRPCENGSMAFLWPSTPFELLWSCRPEDPTGQGLVAEALRALGQDLTDSKRQVLVLSDWLEENGQPEHRLLREFCLVPQRWNRHCLVPAAGKPTPAPMPPYPEPTMGKVP